eukprot:PhF_6_TR7962/c1_g1_i6/m.12071
MVSQCPYHPAVFCGLIAVLKVHCKNNTRKAKTMKNHLKTAHDFLQPLQSSFSLASRDECFQNQLVCRNPGSLQQQQSCPDPQLFVLRSDRNHNLGTTSSTTVVECQYRR